MRLELRPDSTSFEGEAGDTVAGSGYRIEGEPTGIYKTKVAGVSHKREALQSDRFKPGEELALVPEPENPHDPDAVGVWDSAQEQQVGYLPREVARLIGRRLKQGRVAKAISLWEWIQQGSGERVGLEILVAPDVPIQILE